MVKLKNFLRWKQLQRQWIRKSDSEAKGMGELWAWAKQIEGEKSLEKERNEKRKKVGRKESGNRRKGDKGRETRGLKEEKKCENKLECCEHFPSHGRVCLFVCSQFPLNISYPPFDQTIVTTDCLQERDKRDWLYDQ